MPILSTDLESREILGLEGTLADIVPTKGQKKQSLEPEHTVARSLQQAQLRFLNSRLAKAASRPIVLHLRRLPES